MVHIDEVLLKYKSRPLFIEISYDYNSDNLYEKNNMEIVNLDGFKGKKLYGF